MLSFIHLLNNKSSHQNKHFMPYVVLGTVLAQRVKKLETIPALKEFQSSEKDKPIQ